MLRLTREQYETFKAGVVRFYGEDWKRLSRRQQRMAVRVELARFEMSPEYQDYLTQVSMDALSLQ